MKAPKISIIIPSRPKEKCLPEILEQLVPSPNWEVIIVEAGRSLGNYSGCLNLRSPITNRAYQMNLGAKHAKGNLLLFLHADTLISPDSLIPLFQRLKRQKQYVGGCYRFALADDSWQARVMELGVLLREIVFSLPYGDQALFVWRDAFWECGGFPIVPVMEDVLLIEKLKAKGRLHFFEDRATTSARKWKKKGYFKTMFVNWQTMLLWKLGTDLEALAQARGNYFKD